MIPYDCPHCGQEMESPEGRMNALEKCPKCGKQVVVPETQVGRQARLARTSERMREMKICTRVVLAILAGLAVLTGIIVPACTWSHLDRFGLVETHIEAWLGGIFFLFIASVLLRIRGEIHPPP